MLFAGNACGWSSLVRHWVCCLLALLQAHDWPVDTTDDCKWIQSSSSFSEESTKKLECHEVPDDRCIINEWQTLEGAQTLDLTQTLVINDIVYFSEPFAEDHGSSRQNPEWKNVRGFKRPSSWQQANGRRTSKRITVCKQLLNVVGAMSRSGPVTSDMAAFRDLTAKTYWRKTIWPTSRMMLTPLICTGWFWSPTTLWLWRQIYSGPMTDHWEIMSTKEIADPDGKKTIWLGQHCYDGWSRRRWLGRGETHCWWDDLQIRGFGRWSWVQYRCLLVAFCWKSIACGTQVWKWVERWCVAVSLLLPFCQ